MTDDERAKIIIPLIGKSPVRVEEGSMLRYTIVDAGGCVWLYAYRREKILRPREAMINKDGTIVAGLTAPDLDEILEAMHRILV